MNDQSLYIGEEIEARWQIKVCVDEESRGQYSFCGLKWVRGDRVPFA